MESELLTSSKTTIPPEDRALTPPSVRQALLQVLERISALEEELSKLRIENQWLREQTRASSRNSSQPPSNDTLSAPPRKKRKSSGKKRGGQPGHQGHQRKFYPPEECRSLSDHRPTECGDCGTALFGNDPHPVRHQLVELPEVNPLVDEYRLHQLTCPDCGEVTRASLPVGVTTSGYGSRLAAFIAGPRTDLMLLPDGGRHSKSVLMRLAQIGTL